MAIIFLMVCVLGPILWSASILVPEQKQYEEKQAKMHEYWKNNPMTLDTYDKYEFMFEDRCERLIEEKFDKEEALLGTDIAYERYFERQKRYSETRINNSRAYHVKDEAPNWDAYSIL